MISLAFLESQPYNSIIDKGSGMNYGKQYNIYAVPSSDFVFMQTPLEKKLNIGCLRIKHTSFWMVGVKNIAETKEYIQINFPNWE